MMRPFAAKWPYDGRCALFYVMSHLPRKARLAAIPVDCTALLPGRAEEKENV